MIFRILAKNVANITKAAFYLSRLTFCRKKCFGENEINTCGFSWKTSQTFGGKVYRRNLWGNKFCKKGNSSHFLTLGKKVSNFSTKIARRAVITTFYVSRGRILGKKIWKYTVLWSSRTPRKTFWTLCEEFFAGLSNMHFTRPKGVFGRNFCLKSALHIHGFQVIIDAGLLHKTFR